MVFTVKLIPMNSKQLLIFNPAAKCVSEKKIDRAIKLLRAAGSDLEVWPTEKRGDAEFKAKHASENGFSLVIAAGGDGTYNEVANGLAHTDCQMAILPLGTTNVLAKELDIPENIEKAVNIILKGAVHTVSLGKIVAAHHGAPVSRYFFLMAGIGFDGSAIYNFSARLKKYSGKGAYIAGGLKALIKYSPEILTFKINGKDYKGYSTIIGNASKYGGNMKATPDASLLEPALYVCIMHGGKRLDVVRYTAGIITGRHLRFKDVTYLKASAIEVNGAAPIQIDGDYVGRTPAIITVSPEALKLIY